MSQYIVKRLADASAFVVFDRNTHKTIVIQTSSIGEVFEQQNYDLDATRFLLLEEEEQLAMLNNIDFSEYFT